jgi:hypothetical protein
MRAFALALVAMPIIVFTTGARAQDLMLAFASKYLTPIGQTSSWCRAQQ